MIHPFLTRDIGERIAVQSDHPFKPTVRRAHQLVHRQRIKKFVGDDQQRGIIRQGRGVVMVVAIGEGRALKPAQGRRGFDKVHLRCEVITRGGVQRIARQRAATGAKLDIVDVLARAHPHPQISQPQPDQLAKHLRDFGRGDEIALLAERIAAGVIARVAFADIVRKADGAGFADQAAQAFADIDRGARQDFGFEPGLFFGGSFRGCLFGKPRRFVSRSLCRDFSFYARLFLGSGLRCGLSLAASFFFGSGFLGGGLGLGFGFEARLLLGFGLGFGLSLGGGLGFGAGFGFGGAAGFFFGHSAGFRFRFSLAPSLFFGSRLGLGLGFAARLFLRFGFGLRCRFCLGARFRFSAGFRIRFSLGPGFGFGLFLGARFGGVTLPGFVFGLGLFARLPGCAGAFFGFSPCTGEGFGFGTRFGVNAGFGFGFGAGLRLGLQPRFFSRAGALFGFRFEARLLFGAGLGVGCGLALLLGLATRLFLRRGEGFRFSVSFGVCLGRRLIAGLTFSRLGRKPRFRRSLGCSVSGVFGIDQSKPAAPRRRAGRIQAGCAPPLASGCFRSA